MTNLNPREHWIDGSGGKLFVRHWPAAGEAKANLIICPGFNSHSGQYQRAAGDFAARGYNVVAVDLRGRGCSEGERFFVDDIADYVDDLSRAIEHGRTEYPGRPTFLLGHSAGGVTAVTYTLDYQDRIDGLICESFAFRVPAPDLALKLMEGASHVVPHVHVLALKMDDFSRDPEWVATLKADPLTKDESQPVATVAALARADERLEREFSRITLPVVILHGTADHATWPDGSEQFYREVGSADKTLKLYDGYFHDPLNDLGREAVFADIIGWLDDHAGRTATIKAPMPPVTA